MTDPMQIMVSHFRTYENTLEEVFLFLKLFAVSFLHDHQLRSKWESMLV